MLECIVVDDEFGAIEILSKYIKDTPFLLLKGTFRNPLQALEFLRKEKVDLLFLDINMPNLNGMQFLSSLTNPPMVIFSTAYQEYALESYERNAIDYLLKPFDFSRFLKSVQKAMDKVSVAPSIGETQPTTITVKSGSKLHVLQAQELIYLEKQDHYVNFVTKNKAVLSRMTMNEAEAILNPAEFIRVHRSFIVCLRFISSLQSDQVILGEHKIPLGAKYRDQVMARFKHFGA